MTREESIKEYYFRINKSIDYIKENLDKDLSLDNVASVSTFSKFHFHRIFKSVTGITMNEFIKNARIERSLFFLMNNPSISISEISTYCGFSSISAFSRSFRETQNASPSEWKAKFNNSKICITDSNNRQSGINIEDYLAFKLNKSKMNKVDKIDFEIKEMEELNVIYIRNLHIHKHDSETFSKMFEQLFSWAMPRNLIHFPQTKALTVYRSNANLSGMIQADVCLTVPETTVGEGIIGTTKISGGLIRNLSQRSQGESCYREVAT